MIVPTLTKIHYLILPILNLQEKSSNQTAEKVGPPFHPITSIHLVTTHSCESELTAFPQEVKHTRLRHQAPRVLIIFRALIPMTILPFLLLTYINMYAYFYSILSSEIIIFVILGFQIESNCNLLSASNITRYDF